MTKPQAGNQRKPNPVILNQQRQNSRDQNARDARGKTPAVQ